MSESTEQVNRIQNQTHLMTLAQRFVEQVGGIENARLALERLQEASELRNFVNSRSLQGPCHR